MRLDRFRALACVLAAAGLATGIAACGGDDDEAQTLDFKVASNGAVTGPSSAETGSAEITLDNGAKKDADMQLIRAEGNLSAQEFIEAFGPVITDEAPLPDGIFAAGGVGTIKGGKSATVTQVLEPGTYYALNITGGPRPTPQTISVVEVTGDASDEELEEADSTVDAIDYGFEAEGLKAGNNQIAFNNAGAQPHHIVAAPLQQGATEAEAKEYFGSPDSTGPPPIDQRGVQTTAALEGGTSQLTDLNLKKGDYVLLCFISDRQGGPPHVAKGMVTGVEVR